MRILCTNDDGIHAPGLAVLEGIARHFSDNVWIVAPETEQSGASRALTLTAPIRVRTIGPRRFALTGTPTDCVTLALHDLLDGLPDLVLSGVNNGQNIAEDVTFSGTIAGAMQGMAMGAPSVAFSQARGFRGESSPLWETAAAHGPGVLRALLKHGWPANVVMNVNFPDRPPEDVGGVEVTVQGRRDNRVLYAEKRTDLRGQTYYWQGFNGQLSNPPHGTDLRAIYDGRISITPLHVDLTERDVVHRLKGLIGGAPPKA